MPDAPLIVIVGGGISGLATALALRDLATQHGHPPLRLLVLEAHARVGGTIRTEIADGYTCEWGVNGFLNKEPKTLELCQRLHLEEELLPASAAFAKRYIYTRDRLRPIHMHPLRFMLSSLLPWSGRLRLLREPWIKTRVPPDGDESVADFARRRIGPAAFQLLVDPMQTGIFAGDPEQLSVRSCFPRVVEVEEEYGSLIRGMTSLAKERRRKGEPLPGAGPAGHLVSFTHGMQVLPDRLHEELGEIVRCSCPVTALSRIAEKWRVEGPALAGGLMADAVVLACPAYAAAEIVRPLDPGLSTTLAEIFYPPLAVVCLGFQHGQMKHPLDGFGYLVPRSAQIRILGTLWSSTIFSNNSPKGHVLLRVMIGGARDPGVLQLSDDELLSLVCQEVDRIQGIEGPPCFYRIFHHELAIPQYTMGHQDRLARMDISLSRLPGLHLTGNAYRGIGVNDCARQAWPIAEQVLDQLNRRGMGNGAELVLRPE